MSWREIRPIAVGIVRREGDEILVQRYDGDDETFFRPLGGGLEFGERADEALMREFREELDEDVLPGERLAVLENVFEFEGEAGHEVVFVFEAHFANSDVYEREELAGVEDDGTGAFTAQWEPVSRFTDGDAVLYPGGLPELLRE
ncbi:NUDIX hydrolase [Haloarchaeobius sp. TZWWS8]|uniref:NUDIX hydrolase n=1 Tax=Haloarchaeobius sp. TZWWS8 TaxID=3446121 RepID=UPI003EBBC8E6